MNRKDKKLTALILSAIITGSMGYCIADSAADNTSVEAQQILDDISEQEAIYFPTQYTIKEIDTRYQIISMYAVPTIERPSQGSGSVSMPAMKYGGPVRDDKIKKDKIKKGEIKEIQGPMLRYAPPMRTDK